MRVTDDAEGNAPWSSPLSPREWTSEGTLWKSLEGEVGKLERRNFGDFSFFHIYQNIRNDEKDSLEFCDES